MKRIYKIVAYIISIFAFLFVFVSCTDKEVKITNVEMANDANSEILVGGFDYENYSIVITYSDNTTKTLTLDETMLSNEEYLKTFNVGTQILTINYSNYSFDYEIEVKKYTFDDDICFPTEEVIYDGNYHTIEVEGNIPEGTTIVYTNGNSFKDANTYKVSATLANPLYLTNVVTGVFTIKKTVYDVSQLKFEDKEFVYDGQEHSIELINAPKDLNVSYSIGQANTNTAILAGEYEVICHIDAGINYEPVEDLKAKLTIKKATYDMTNFKFANKTVTYTGEAQYLYITNENLLPSGVSVSYENNGNINAGTYEVTAKFISDNANYEPIESKKATLTIAKARYELTGIYLDSETFTFDNKPHSIYYSGNLPQGVLFDGYENNAQTNAGVYTVLAKFTYKDSLNYEPITPISGIMEITKSDLTSITFNDKTVEYTGKNYTISCENVPSGVTVSYNIEGTTQNSVKEPGNYTFTASFTYDELATNNYNPLEQMTATLTINKKTLQSNFANKTVTYDGEEHSIECELTLADQEYVDVSYSIKDGSGNLVPFTSRTEPGSYLVYANFTLKDSADKEEFEAHYNELTTQTATLIIDKVNYTPVFTSRVLTYKANVEQSVIYDTSDLANYPNLEFESITYTNNKQTNKGVYNGSAKFYLTENAKKYYYDIPEQEIIYVIVTNPNKAEVTVTPSFSNTKVTYDGEYHSISAINIPDCISLDFQDNSQLMPGTHDVTVIFTYDDPIIKYYYDLPVGKGTYYAIAGEEDKVYCIVKLIIEKKKYVVTYNNTTAFAYDGTNKVLSVAEECASYISATFEYDQEERIIPGTYTATATPKIIDSNFATIYEVEPSVVEFSIVKADANFSYSGLTVYYDGNAHYINVLGLPADFEVETTGDGKIKPGVYDVDIVFINNSLYYNDIEPQIETLTILSNPVAPAGLINYLNSDGSKSVSQFSTLKELLNSFVDIKGFKVDWTVDYFKSSTEQYDNSDSSRHGSSKNLSDFTFTESTYNDEYVKISLKLTLKEGYEVVDGSMGNNYSALVDIQVGQTKVIDISAFSELFADNASVTLGDSLIKIFEDNIKNFDEVQLVYEADYYKDNTIYTLEEGNVHGQSEFKDDYTFTLATWGDRTCNVTYSLEVGSGYSLYDGTRSYQKFENVCKVMVNPLSEVDISYLENAALSPITVTQYTKLSETINTLVDTNHLDVTWSVVNGDDTYTNLTDYSIRNNTSFTCNIIVNTTDKYSFKNSDKTSYAATLTMNVINRPAVDFTNFETKMSEAGDSIIQRFDYFNDIIKDVTMPENCDYTITIYDVNGEIYEYDSFGEFECENYVNEDTKLKVVFDFYKNSDYLILTDDLNIVDHRTFTYEYSIIKSENVDNVLVLANEIYDEYNEKSIPRYTLYSDIVQSKFDSFAINDYATYTYTISYYKKGGYVGSYVSGIYRSVYNENILRVLGSYGPYNYDYDYKFNVTNIGGTAFDYVLVNMHFEVDKNSACYFNSISEDKYTYDLEIKMYVYQVTVVNDVINEYKNKDFTIRQYQSLSNIDSNIDFDYGTLNSIEVSIKSNNIYSTVYSYYSLNYSYTFNNYGEYKVVYNYSLNKDTVYEENGYGLPYADLTIFVSVTEVVGVITDLEYGYYPTYDQFTPMVDILDDYANCPDERYTKEWFFNALFDEYEDINGTRFVNHIVPSSYVVKFKDGNNNITHTLFGTLDSDAVLGFECTKAILEITYVFDSEDFVFLDYYGNFLGDGTSCTRTFELRVSTSGYTKVDTTTSKNLWANGGEDLNPIAGKEIQAYYNYGLESYLNSYDIYLYSFTAIETDEKSYYKIMNSTDLLQVGYNYYLFAEYHCYGNYYFDIDESNGKPITTYDINGTLKNVRQGVLIDNKTTIQAQLDAITNTIQQGTQFFNFTENTTAFSYLYTVVQNNKTYTNSNNQSNAFFTVSPYYYDTEVSIKISANSYYYIVDATDDLFGYSTYTFSRTILSQLSEQRLG